MTDDKNFSSTSSPGNSGNPLARFSTMLLGSSEMRKQLEALSFFTGRKDSTSIATLVSALQSPVVAVKPQIITHLSMIGSDSIFDALNDSLDKGDAQFRSSLYAAFSEANLGDYYLSKIEIMRRQPACYSHLKKIINFLGKLGAQEMMEPVGHLVFMEDEIIGLALIEALEALDNARCLTFLLAAVRLYSSIVAERALDLIQRFNDKNAILPLVTMLDELSETTAARVVDVLMGFDQDEVYTIICSNLDVENEKLIGNALMYLETVGNIPKARRLREQVAAESERTGVEIKAVVEAVPLSVDVKNIGDIVIMTLKGMLDRENLPRLKRVLEVICTHGETKVVLVCTSLQTLDSWGIAYLHDHDTKLRKMMGGIKYVDLTCIQDSMIQSHMPDAEIYERLPAAVSSFSVERSTSYVMVGEDLFRDGTQIEVTCWFEGEEKTRTTAIEDIESGRMRLSWQVFDQLDLFRTHVNDKVKLVYVKDNNVLSAQSKVASQERSPIPFINVLCPRVMHIVERRKEVRIKTHFKVDFHGLDAQGTVSKTPCPGFCLDINAGGILFLAPVMLSVSSFGILRFPSSEINLGPVLGQIVRRNERIERDRMFYEHGINFAKILDADRSKIKQYVFEKISAGI